jgi:hypothetical protein
MCHDRKDVINMARSKIDPNAMIDRFTYSPGDGHRYRWQAGREVIVVERIITHANGVDLQPTGDTIPIPAARTLTAMAARVDQWRSSR